MTLDELIPESHVFDRLRAADKPALLAELARRAGAILSLQSAGIAAALAAREALGSTGTGAGVAVPHARLSELREPAGFFARLDRPLGFEAVDGRPVDLVVLLLSPAEGAGHLQALAAISRRLRDRDVAAALRASSSATELRATLLGG
jgi:PTS system nitrogen regulatory IIA component